MGGLIAIAIVLFVFGLIMLSGRKQAQQIANLTTSGILGRGLILQADRTSSRTTVNGQSMQQRTLLLDIELPGQQPYEVSVTAAIPRIVEALPGSSVDLRVDPKDPGNVMIVGPAGSSAWLGAANNLLNPALTGIPTAGSGVGCGITLLVLALGFAGAAVAAGLHDSEKKAGGGICAAAERCCNAADGAACSGYRKGSESSCESAYEKYKKKAAKLHKKCD